MATARFGVQWRSQEFSFGGTQGVWATKVPIGAQGEAPGRSSDDKAEAVCLGLPMLGLGLRSGLDKSFANCECAISKQRVIFCTLSRSTNRAQAQQCTFHQL